MGKLALLTTRLIETWPDKTQDRDYSDSSQALVYPREIRQEEVRQSLHKPEKGDEHDQGIGARLHFSVISYWRWVQSA